MDERAYYSEAPATKPARLQCPFCKTTDSHDLRWMVRKKKDRLPPGADERDRGLYAKLRDYMIRVDDAVTCKTCGKKFDIPSQHSMVFIEKGVAAPGPGVTYAGGDDDDSRFNR